MSTPTIDTDVCVIGAGVLGMAHAHEARARGLKVVVLERHERAVGASVRNFGHVFVTAMGDGEALECALRARRRWLELGARAGLEVLEAGSVIVASHDDELEVMAGAAADERRGARLISASEVARLAPIPVHGLRGALHGTLDLRVNPRLAVARLAALLEVDDDAEVVWGAPVHEIEPGCVHSSRVQVRAPLVVVCPGPDYAWLAPELAPTRAGLTRCKLQMLRVRAPGERRYHPALLTGLSLLRYPAFTTQPGFERVQARIAQDRPELFAAGVHVIVTQLPGGDLILGDTHEYGDTVSPFGEEELDELVLAEARALLGVDVLEVRERWHGVYPKAAGEPFLVAAPLPGVRVVEVVAGVGMTTALGLAPRVIDELVADTGSRPVALG
jgi:FAD dependent oxidoreductase TIGR03364